MKAKKISDTKKDLLHSFWITTKMEQNEKIAK